MDQVCQDKIGRLGGVAGSVMLYVISTIKIQLLTYYKDQTENGFCFIYLALVTDISN
jgi:hypothetical protein